MMHKRKERQKDPEDSTKRERNLITEMQETKKMDLKQLEEVMKEPDGSLVDKIIQERKKPQLDSATALQAFLDKIPISSIPGIKNSPELQVLALNAGDSVRDAIELLYEKNVCGAPIADVPDPDATIGRFRDKYIGFIDLTSIILWSLEKCENAHIQTSDNGGESGVEPSKTGFFTMLEQNPNIGQTKIGELAKSFLWDPFFPVLLDNTLFHVLLLLSKHPLNVVPIERPDSRITGFVTQNAVIQLLLQSDGLDWFDGIADKALSEFRFENKDQVFQVYGDQSVAEAVQILCRNQVGVIAVVDRGTKRLIGNMMRSDIYLLLENDDFYHKKETITMQEFIHMDTTKTTDSDPTIERDIGALLSAGVLRLRNSFLPRMDQPVTNQKTDTLKQAMKNLAETKSCFSFLVDDSQQPTGVLTIKDVIIQFAPPSVDSSFHGGGFFESALEQSGCKIKNETVICDH